MSFRHEQSRFIVLLTIGAAAPKSALINESMPSYYSFVVLWIIRNISMMLDKQLFE